MVFIFGYVEVDVRIVGCFGVVFELKVEIVIGLFGL